MVYALIGRNLFHGDKEKTGYFLILVTMLTIFSGYSERTSGLFLLIRLWQGKAFLAGILLLDAVSVFKALLPGGREGGMD